MKNNVICLKCRKVHELTEEEKNDFVCPDCGERNPVGAARKAYETEIGSIIANADKSYGEAFSYEEAHDLYENVLEFEPDSLKAFMGSCLSLVRCSTIKKEYFSKVNEMIQNKDMELNVTTYVRLGRFIEQLYISTFIYIRKAYNLYYKVDSLVEKAAICRDFWEIKKLYKTLHECLDAFSEEEIKESFALQEADIVSFESNMNKVIGDEGNALVEGDTLFLFINDQKLESSLLKEEDFEGFNDEIMFQVNNDRKGLMITFAFLILFLVVMITGLVLAFQNIAAAGYSLVVGGLVGFVIVYIIHKRKRDKFQEEANKY